MPRNRTDVNRPDLLALVRSRVRESLVGQPDYSKPELNAAIIRLDDRYEQGRNPLLNAIKQQSSMSDESAELVLTAYLAVKNLAEVEG